MRTLACFLVALVVACRVARAEPPAADASRLLQAFSFEERLLGNAEDVPMHWHKVDGVQFPHYVTGRLSTDRHRSGSYSFRMDLDGGSCAYGYEVARLPVRAGAHYRFGGYCQTTPLTYARARLSVALADAAGRAIPNTTRYSEPYAGPGEGGDDWHELSADVAADARGAAFLLCRMELVQPDVYAPASLGDRTLFLQDIRGSAWFDDLMVTQVPWVTLSTDRPANVFRRGDPAAISVLVNDRSTDDLTAQLVVTDAAGRLVYQRTGGVDLSAAEVVGPTAKRTTLPLPGLPGGWYEASLVMMSRGTYVGRQSLAFVQLADEDSAAAADPRFGVSAVGLPFDALGGLPDLLTTVSAGRVKLPVWTAAGRVDGVDGDGFHRLIGQLRERGVAAEACLVAPPGAARWQQWDGAAADAPWRAELAELIGRHAGHVGRWQLGPDDAEEFATDPALRRVYADVAKQFAELVDKPDVAVPCPVSRELPAGGPTSLALLVPGTVTPAEIPIYAAEFGVGGNPRASLTLPPLDRERYGREAQVADLAERVVYALSAGAARVDVPVPLVARRQGDAVVREPTELLPVLRTLWSNLAGSTYCGPLPMAADVRAFLFDRDGQGTVVMWTDDDGGVRPVSVNLGRQPVQVDLWGNATPLLQPLTNDGAAGGAAGGAAAGLMRMRVGHVPTLLTHVDGRLARFRAALAIDRPLVEGSYQPHVRHLLLSNPYPYPVAGTVRLRGPAGWTITPPTVPFSLAAGESVRAEVGVALPYNTLAGPNVVTAEVDLQAEQPVRFTAPLTMTVGLSDVGMTVACWRDGADLVVQQRVTNYGDRPVNYDATAVYPGQPRIERPVVDLAPGQTTIKRYRFAGVRPAAGPCRVRVGLKEADGPRVLNTEAVAE